MSRAKREQVEETLRLANASGRGGGGHVSGLQINLGRLDEEYVPALKDWRSRINLYQRMGNDAKIAATIRANILPMISAVRWTVEGGSERAADLVAANLLRQGDPALWCETSWTQRIFESLLSLQYGISLFGKTREIVDGLMIFRRLTYLHPRSLGGPTGPWEFDAGGTRLVAIHRSFMKPDATSVMDERIPIEDVFPVVWWMAGENWEGVPIIRSMYRAWVEKDLASKIQMVDLQNRGVGIPKGKLAAGDSDKAAQTLKQMAADLRGGSKERQFLLLSDGQEMEFLTSTGTTLDAAPILDMRNNEIAAAATTDFQQQGQTASGSRATGSVLMVSYMQQIDAVREIFQEQINHGAGYCSGLVEELVYENFGPDEECPRIVGSRVSPTEQLDNIPNIVDAVNKGSLTHDLAVENHVRKGYGIAPLTPEAFQKAKDEAKMIPNVGGRPDRPTPVDREEPRDDEAGRAFGLKEKKTPDAKPQRRNGSSYVWLRSKAS